VRRTPFPFGETNANDVHLKEGGRCEAEPKQGHGFRIEPGETLGLRREVSLPFLPEDVDAGGYRRSIHTS